MGYRQYRLAHDSLWFSTEIFLRFMIQQNFSNLSYKINDTWYLYINLKLSSPAHTKVLTNNKWSLFGITIRVNCGQNLSVKFHQMIISANFELFFIKIFRNFLLSYLNDNEWIKYWNMFLLLKLCNMFLLLELSLQARNM